MQKHEQTTTKFQKKNTYKEKLRISYTEDTLMHSAIALNAEEKTILHGINFAGPLGNIAQLSACCRYKNPATNQMH